MGQQTAELAGSQQLGYGLVLHANIWYSATFEILYFQKIVQSQKLTILNI